LAIFDVFKAHRSQALLDKLYQHNIRAVFVPQSCTDQLQPLDATPNKLFKDELKSCFQAYYSDCVAEKIKNNLNVVDIDLRTSSIKEIHAVWLMKAHETISSNIEMIKSAFDKCGI
jgi:hypothetical protein